MIIKIKKPRFEELDFLISSTIGASTILKIMIFIDNIKIADKMMTYL